MELSNKKDGSEQKDDKLSHVMDIGGETSVQAKLERIQTSF